jgi:hypothetical protein
VLKRTAAVSTSQCQTTLAQVIIATETGNKCDSVPATIKFLHILLAARIAALWATHLLTPVFRSSQGTLRRLASAGGKHWA